MNLVSFVVIENDDVSENREKEKRETEKREKEYVVEDLLTVLLFDDDEKARFVGCVFENDLDNAYKILRTVKFSKTGKPKENPEFSSLLMDACCVATVFPLTVTIYDIPKSVAIDLQETISSNPLIGTCMLAVARYSLISFENFPQGVFLDQRFFHKIIDNIVPSRLTSSSRARYRAELFRLGLRELIPVYSTRLNTETRVLTVTSFFDQKRVTEHPGFQELEKNVNSSKLLTEHGIKVEYVADTRREWKDGVVIIRQ